MRALNIYLAAIAVTCNAPTNAMLLLEGIRGIREWERTSVEQVRRIISGYQENELTDL